MFTARMLEINTEITTLLAVIKLFEAQDLPTKIYLDHIAELLKEHIWLCKANLRQ